MRYSGIMLPYYIIATSLLTAIKKNELKGNLQNFSNKKARKGVGSYLGPGSYNLLRDFDIPKNSSRGNPFVSKDQRFKKEGKEGPGPGQYMCNNNPWHLRTFNSLYNP
eukprot:TRINITY_DN11651_c0_g1_i5.p4 TRINITY_DN11651_c0_g1~~TRINITY_DN11651_c0_g1_i5.p4  ORF type:complete len:108 (+),score=8.59 TRINITY_DN11651_c0_g1_i5:1519-1842(+)